MGQNMLYKTEGQIILVLVIITFLNYKLMNYFSTPCLFHLKRKPTLHQKKKKSNSGRHSEVIAGEQIVTTITIFIRILLRRGVVSIYASFQLLLLVRCQMHFSLEQVEKESILYFVRKMCCFCDTKNVIPLRNAI